MSDLKPSTAPDADDLDGSERIPCTQAGSSAVLTPEQILTYIDPILGTSGGTDNAVIRADAAGGSSHVQASTVFVTDAGVLALEGVTGSFPGLFHLGSGALAGVTASLSGFCVFVAASVKTPDNTTPKVAIGSNLALASNAAVTWQNGTSVSSGMADAGLARLAAAQTVATDGGAGIGSLNGLRPPTSAAGPATTAQLPTAGECCLHKNTLTGVVSLAYNDGGTIKIIALA